MTVLANYTQIKAYIQAILGPSFVVYDMLDATRVARIFVASHNQVLLVPSPPALETILLTDFPSAKKVLEIRH